MVLNQNGFGREKRFNIDSKKLETLINNRILETNAKANIGIEEIKNAIRNNEFSVSDKAF